MNRVYAVAGSPIRQAKLEAFYVAQLHLLEQIHFDALSQSGKVEYLLLRSRLQRKQKQVTDEGRLDAELAPIVPFQQIIVDFEESRRRMETMDAAKAAISLTKLNSGIADAGATTSKADPAALNRAATRLSQLRTVLRNWYEFYDLYDPKFSWWVDAEYKKADTALDELAQALHTASGAPGALATGGGRGGGGGGRGRRGGGGGGAGGGGGQAGGGRAAARGPLGSNEELSGAGR